MNSTRPFGERYVKKARSMRRYISNFLAPAELLERYRDQKFQGGPSKFRLLREVLVCDISPQSETYLNEVLGGPGLRRLRDCRTPVEYGIDLSLGWLKEDATLILLKKHGIMANLAGSDMHREFLKSSKVRSDSDMKISFRGKTRQLEVVYDASETWKNEDRCDLRNQKLPKIREESGIILGIDIINIEAFVYCPAKNADLRVSQNKRHGRYGDKSVYSIHGISEITAPLHEALAALTGLIGGGE